MQHGNRNVTSVVIQSNFLHYCLILNSAETLRHASAELSNINVIYNPIGCFFFESLHADRRTVPHDKFMDESAGFFFSSKAPVQVKATARCASIFFF